MGEDRFPRVMVSFSNLSLKARPRHCLHGGGLKTNAAVWAGALPPIFTFHPPLPPFSQRSTAFSGFTDGFSANGQCYEVQTTEGTNTIATYGNQLLQMLMPWRHRRTAEKFILRSQAVSVTIDSLPIGSCPN